MPSLSPIYLWWWQSFSCSGHLLDDPRSHADPKSRSRESQTLAATAFLAGMSLSVTHLKSDCISGFDCFVTAQAAAFYSFPTPLQSAPSFVKEKFSALNFEGVEWKKSVLPLLASQIWATWRLVSILFPNVCPTTSGGTWVSILIKATWP